MILRPLFYFSKPLRQLGLIGLVFALFLTTARALDVTQPSAPTEPAAAVEDPAKPLGELVGKLSSLDTLTPRHLADFANETLAYSQALQGAKQQVSEKPIRDALDAVAQGRALDPKAADWDDLQARLEKFLENPEQQKQDQQQKQDKQDQQKNKQQDKQDQQNQQNQSGDKNDQNQQNKQDQQKQDQQQQGQSGQNDEQKQDQQSQQNQQKGDQQQSQPGESGKQDKQEGQNSDSTKEQPARPQKESAFGDMQKKDADKDEKKDDQSAQNAEQQSQDQQQQQPQPQPGEMQQIGGSEGKEQQPVDSRMIMPLQQLEQVRGKDSPAVIFQRMQAAQSGTSQVPAGAQRQKGKDW